MELGVWQGDKVTRWQGDKVTRWQGDKVTRWQGDKVTRWQGDKVTRWQGDKVTRWQGDKVTRWQGDKVTRWLGLRNLPQYPTEVCILPSGHKSYPSVSTELGSGCIASPSITRFKLPDSMIVPRSVTVWTTVFSSSSTGMKVQNFRLTGDDQGFNFT